MDLVYTNAKGIDQGILRTYAFDLSFGANENDFEITLRFDDPTLEAGAFVYIEGTEYGGTIGGIKTNTNGTTCVYTGRTWHGILNSKVIQPDSGEDHFVVSGDAHTVLSALVSRLGLSTLFVVPDEASGINISTYKFKRYCKAYDGIIDMLADNHAKLKIAWEGRMVQLSVEPVVDYTNSPVDGDVGLLSVERHDHKVNHLICLGRGELADREVIHLYVDQFGRIGSTQYFTGIDEITDTYDNTNVESSSELQKEGTSKLKELRNNDKADITLPEITGLRYDIGDTVAASEVKSGVSVAATVSQKIVKIKNGVISTEYKTGG